MKLDLINNALSGFTSTRLSSLIGRDSNTETALSAWDYAFREVTMEHEWSFLITQVKMETPDEINEEDYKYRYKLPDNVLSFHSINNAYLRNLFLYFYDYNKKYSPLFKAQKPFLYCNMKPVNIVYLRNDIANLLLPSDFQQCMVLYMKMELAIALGRNQQQSQQYEGRAIRALRRAKMNDVFKIKNLIRKPTDYQNNPSNFGIRER